MSSSADFSLNKTIPVFDGANFLEWQPQMKGFLQLKGWWHIVNSTITQPVVGAAGATQADVNGWLMADKMALGAITLKLVHTLRTGMVAATSAATWTALTTAFTHTGVSAVYQDFKAAMRVRIGTSNPAKDITRLTTHLERLHANNVVIPDYVQGMMLLNAIPDEWDHIAAYYVQTTNAVANVAIAAIRTAILAEHDRLGGTKQNQSHIADKISAVKRKGKSPKFSSQRNTDYEPASNEAGPSSSKKRRSRGGRGKGKQPVQGQGSHHHSHLASWLKMNKELNNCPQYERFLAQQAQPSMSLNRGHQDWSAKVQQQKAEHPQIALQPSRAGPSTTTIVSFKPSGATYYSKPTNRLASTYSGQPSRPGPATLLEARSLAERLNVDKNAENLRALEALRDHRRHVEKSRAYADAVAAAPPPPPSTSRVEEVPDVITQAEAKDKRPKQTTIYESWSPLGTQG